ncbi:MAG: hypothetical protein LBP26_05810 [Clostridiales bacterium]|jgi:hypothetical protein|nr:hypothetical protein [Clostridiales bacterium]
MNVNDKNGSAAAKRLAAIKKTADAPKLVGDPSETVPFAWRAPLRVSSGKKPSRILKNLTAAEKGRSLPAVTDPER